MRSHSTSITRHRIAGFFVATAWKSRWAIDNISVCSIVSTVAERSRPSSKVSSPKMSPGPNVPMIFCFPSSACRYTFAAPERIT